THESVDGVRVPRRSSLSHGRVLASGSPGEVQSLVPGLVVTFESTSQREAIARIKPHYAQVESYGLVLHVFTPEQEPSTAVARIRDVLGDLSVERIQTEKPELEDVVVALLLKERHEQGE